MFKTLLFFYFVLLLPLPLLYGANKYFTLSTDYFFYLLVGDILLYVPIIKALRLLHGGKILPSQFWKACLPWNTNQDYLYLYFGK